MRYKTTINGKKYQSAEITTIFDVDSKYFLTAKKFTQTKTAS